MRLTMSICSYQNGGFDVIFRDEDTNRELCLSGTQKLSEEDFEFADQIAPGCLWTEYKRVTE